MSLGNGDRSLVLAEVAGIQDWIVGHATELQIIRGGSVLLERAFEEVERLLTERLGGPPGRPGSADDHPWTLVARSSGRLSAFVPTAEADAVAASLRSLLARSLPGLTILVGHSRVGPRDESGSWGFDRARQQARGNQVAAGTRRPSLYHLGTATCDASGIESALREETWNEGWHLSHTSEQRRQAGTRSVDRDDVEVERDMSAIGAATLSSRFGGYVAVVVADGNAIGTRFQNLTDAAALASESESVYQGIRQAVDAAYRAAAEAHLERGGQLPLPVNPVVHAGDDLRFVVPAHVGLPFAAALTSTAENLEACAGVLLCHAALPFSVAHEAGEELLGTAKRTSRASSTGTEPYVAFAFETGASVRSDLGGGRLTGSPYRAAAVDALLRTSATLEAPASQLYRMAAALRTGGRVAEREWALLVLSAPETLRRQLVDLWGALGSTSDLGSTPYPLDRQGSHGGEATPLGDLLLLRHLSGRSEEGHR